MTTDPLPSIAYPGLPLGPSTSYLPGPGTHLHTTPNGATQIISSLSGRPTLSPFPKSDPATSKITTSPAKYIISIPRILPSPTHAPIPSANVSSKNALPQVGSVVLAVVRRVRTRQVECGIVVVYPSGEGGGIGGSGGVGGGEYGTGGGEGVVCADEWQAVLRKEDVRATEKEKVICGEGFRVGDVVRGVVISLGDQSNYYLTTAKNELGVIMARSEAGNTMVPISWERFRDPETGVTESRKVAKPF